MPVTQFNDPILLPNGDLKVSGPFDAEGADIQGKVTIRFLLIQDTAAHHGQPVIVDSVASWSPGDPDWVKTIKASRVPSQLRCSPTPSSPGKEGLVRAIGQAIVVRRVPSDEIPVFETLTWCVTKEVVAEAGDSAA